MKELQSFLDALKSVPNDDDKRGYFMALSRCPDLLACESCIERFLRSERDNASKASRKFVHYWNKRLQVYGETAAFLPLSLSHPALLSESCQEILKAGWIAPLPPDGAGRRVCLLNIAIEESLDHISLSDKMRCLFFMLQCMSEEEEAQTDGISLLIIYGNGPGAQPVASIKAFDDILQVMPVLVTCLHIVHMGDQPSSSEFFENFVGSALKPLLCAPVEQKLDIVLQQRSHIHVGQPSRDLLRCLRTHGLFIENLPEILGGNWTPAHHAAWLKVRLEDECHRAKAPRSLHDYAFPGEEETIEISDEERDKARDAWHSKQKRARKLCKTKALELCINHLQQKKYALRNKGNLLRTALDQANKIVADIGTNNQVPHRTATSTVFVSSPTSSASHVRHYPHPTPSRKNGNPMPPLQHTKLDKTVVDMALQAEEERHQRNLAAIEQLASSGHRSTVYTHEMHSQPQYYTSMPGAYSPGLALLQYPQQPRIYIMSRTEARSDSAHPPPLLAQTAHAPAPYLFPAHAHAQANPATGYPTPAPSYQPVYAHPPNIPHAHHHPQLVYSHPAVPTHVPQAHGQFEYARPPVNSPQHGYPQQPVYTQQVYTQQVFTQPPFATAPPQPPQAPHWY